MTIKARRLAAIAKWAMPRIVFALCGAIGAFIILLDVNEHAFDGIGLFGIMWLLPAIIGTLSLQRKQ